MTNKTLSQQIKPKITELTKREREILKLLYSGLNANKIADRLCIALSTAKTHKKNIMKKLNTHSVIELLAQRIDELEHNQLSKGR